MTAIIIIITIIIPTLSAAVCARVWFIGYVCVCHHIDLKIQYAGLQEFFMNLVHLHGV